MEGHRSASSNHLSSMDLHHGDAGDDEEVAETDPDGRYYRYMEVVGRGRFKCIYKAFDTQIGIDVAWSKISAESHHLTDTQLDDIVTEMGKGLDLDHPNIIKCFKCWEDAKAHCINLITELFTSGNLRQYRNLHKHLDLKAIKRIARQILKGLDYLHSMSPPVVHGDLRCDKIYVNGHSGEIKIGDLGLATLMPLRFEGEAGEHAAPNGTTSSLAHLKEPRYDIFAFGLCVLELLTFRQLDPQHFSGAELPPLVEAVADPDARTFIAACLGMRGAPGDGEGGGGWCAGDAAGVTPTAGQLLDDPFLQVKKAAPPEANKESPPAEPHAPEDGEGRIAIGKLRGEDYNFEFHGKVREGKMHFRLHMTQVSDHSVERPVVRTIDFVYDPDVDTADNLAAEISDEFELSATDTEICAAALREWLAKEMPESEGGK